MVLIVPFYAEFVTAQTNQTILPIQTGSSTYGTPVYQAPSLQPVQQQGNAMPIPGIDLVAIGGIIGVAYNYLKQYQGKNKQEEENKKLERELGEKNRQLEEITNGSLMLAKVTNQLAMSLKATDNGDERFARILYLFGAQLNKVEVFKPTLNEKIKTTDTDIFFNNKSILEIIQNNYEHTVTENKLYYENLNPTLNDVCENKIVRSISNVDKMTTRG